MNLEEIHVLPMDLQAIASAVDTETMARMGGSLETMLDTAINLWPYIGFNDLCAAREYLSGWVVESYGAEEGEQLFEDNVDKCFKVMLNVTNRMAPGLDVTLKCDDGRHPHAQPTRMVVGGRLESLMDDAVAFRVYYEKLD